MAVMTAIQCPDVASGAHQERIDGLERAVMLIGTAMTNWARERAEAKAMSRRRSALSNLSDAERADLYREATALRDAAYAERARWHAIG